MRHASLRTVCWSLLIVGAPVWASAQQSSDEDTTTSQREWAYSSRGPTRSQAGAGDPNRPWWDQGPWFASAAAGPAWFGGDGMSGSADFAADVQVGLELSDEVSLFGSYTLGLAQTERRPVAGGPIDDDTHDLHVLAVGVGLKADVTPEVQVFIEPRVGVLFGSDADAAPVGMLSGGVLLSVREGIALRLALTGLVTDSDISTAGEDAHLDSGVMVTLGLSFEF